MALDLLEDVSDPELVAFDVKTTLADQIAFNRYLWKRRPGGSNNCRW